MAGCRKAYTMERTQHGNTATRLIRTWQRVSLQPTKDGGFEKLRLTPKGSLEYHSPPIFSSADCRRWESRCNFFLCTFISRGNLPQAKMTPAHRKTLILLLAAALVVRLAAGWAWQSRLDGRFGMGDSESYWALASAIAAGAPYEFGPSDCRSFGRRAIRLCWHRSFGSAGDNDVGVYLARAEAACSACSPCWPCGGSHGCCLTAHCVVGGGNCGVLPWRYRDEHPRIERGAVLPLDVGSTGALDVGLAKPDAIEGHNVRRFSRVLLPGLPR